MTRVEAIADWAASVEFDDVPSDVVARCRTQQRSVFGGIAASSNDPAAGRVLTSIERWTSDGPAPLVGRRRRVASDDALYASATLSIALDFDDYVCFGHTGHTAVLVPRLLAAETGATAREQLVAQVIANEVEARLGGACLIGPLNGQLWSFIHSAGSALAAGRLFQLDRRRLAHALAIALYQAPRPTVPGFMAPDSKLLTAAEPAVMGLRAARLAEAGVTGPLDVLDRRDGFLGAFADAPLPGMLGGLGQGWATRTLCVKPYPGCAYLDTTLDALIELGPPKPDEIDEVVVDAGLLTWGMDALSSPYAGDIPTPVTINFSVAMNVAIASIAGELTPRQLEPRWLTDHAPTLRDVASRVRLGHDWALTKAAATPFLQLLPPRAVARDAGLRQLGRGLRRARSHHPSAVRDISDLRGIGALLRRDPRRSPVGFWDPDALETFTMRLPARVRVRTRDGRERVAQADIPRGGAGHEVGPDGVARDKLAEWGPLLWGATGTDAIERAIESDADDLWTLL